MTAAVVILAGGLGAGLRYVVGTAIQHRLATELPWGTAVVNTAGAFMLGVVVGSGGVGPGTEVAAGFLAGFTTYSTWMIECVHLWAEGRSGRRRVLIDATGLLVAGLVAAFAGFALGVRLLG
jgi:CrcB protein